MAWKCRLQFINFAAMSVYHQVILSLGSNIGDRRSYLQQAIIAIHQSVGIISQMSSIYETPAWGFESDAFYNIALTVSTHYSATEVLAKCLAIEKKLGRIRAESETYTSRVIDIDVLFYDDAIIDVEQLQIPHPLLHQRAFVLVPLTEIAPTYKHPILHVTIQSLTKQLQDVNDIVKVGELHNPKNDYSFKNLNFISIEGNIGSGKTTLTQKMATDFNGQSILERFADNPFLPKFYEEPERYAFPLEMSFLADRYSQLTEGLRQYDLFNDFRIADYYIYKSLIFAQITLDSDEAQLYRNIFDVMCKETLAPDIYIYLYQNTENLLQNIQKRGRSYESTIPADYLEKINQGYTEFIKTLPPEKVLVIDVTNKDFVKNQNDYLDILSQIDQKVKLKEF